MIDELEVVHLAPAAARGGYAIIAAPHPLYGGSLDNPVVEMLAKGFSAQGLGTVCFNYRGVGQSRGEVSGDIERAAEDYAQVLAWLRSTPTGQEAQLYLAGYSFGAIAAIACARAQRAAGAPSPAALALVAPPLRMLTEVSLADITAPSFVLMGQSDDYLPLDTARAYFARIPRCTVTENEADHFFAYELDEVAAFASAVAQRQL